MEEDSGTYCCKHGCFNISKIDHVDLLACRRCKSFGYCVCKCATFINKF